MAEGSDVSHRWIPSVDRLVGSASDVDVPRMLIVDVVRSVLAQVKGEAVALSEEELVRRVDEEVGRVALSRPQSVVNATGVLLHTNLGRAPLHHDAAAAASEVALSYSNLELSMESGHRGGRGARARHLLRVLTGAEHAMVVNNNAGGLLLALSVLAGGGDVIVSRGELIEIGGSCRLPDLMRSAGVRLVEVGTTNVTRLADYNAAVGDHTGVILKVHPSNFRVEGFTSSVSAAELADWSRANRSVPIVFDVGSGLLDDRVPWLNGLPTGWLRDEPGVRQAIDNDVDVVLFSGDKLFGGPQAGAIVGRRDLIERMQMSPLARALRIDGASLAALAATAELYAGDRGGEVPLWAMAAIPYDLLERRAFQVVESSGVPARVERGYSTPGAGSAPGGRLESPVIMVDGDADVLFRRLLNGSEHPVLARREHGKLVLDLRAVPAEFDEVLARVLDAACRS